MSKAKKHPRLNKDDREQAEKQQAEIKAFQELWFKYLKEFKAAHYDASGGARENEEAFLRLKCQLARKHEYLIHWLGPHYIGAEPITKILRDTLTLHRVSEYKRDFYVKIETAWHRVTLNIARTLGHYRVLLDDSLRS